MRVTSDDDIAPTDEQLTEVIAKRDWSREAWQQAQDACAQLYQRHARKLLVFLAARGNKSDAEDIAQKVWQQVWQRLPESFHGGNFRAWLYQIARNSLIDHGRKMRPDQLGEDNPPMAREADRPDVVLAEQERLTILSRCLEKLRSQDAQSAELVRSRLAGESYPDLCKRLGIKPERAHKMFHLAKENLQRCVERSLP